MGRASANKKEQLRFGEDGGLLVQNGHCLLSSSKSEGYSSATRLRVSYGAAGFFSKSGRNAS